MRELLEDLEKLGRIVPGKSHLIGPSSNVIYGGVGDPMDSKGKGPKYFVLDDILVRNDKGEMIIPTLPGNDMWVKVALAFKKAEADRVAKTLRAFIGERFSVIPIKGKWEKGFGFERGGKILTNAGMADMYQAVWDELDKKSKEGKGDPNFVHGIQWGDTSAKKMLTRTGRDSIGTYRHMLDYAGYILKGAKENSSWKDSDSVRVVSRWGDPRGKRKNLAWIEYEKGGGKTVEGFMKFLRGKIAELSKYEKGKEI